MSVPKLVDSGVSMQQEIYLRLWHDITVLASAVLGAMKYI